MEQETGVVTLASRSSLHGRFFRFSREKLFWLPAAPLPIKILRLFMGAQREHTVLCSLRAGTRKPRTSPCVEGHGSSSPPPSPPVPLLRTYKIITAPKSSYYFMEQETGVEPAGTSLGSWRHTARRFLHHLYYSPKIERCQGKTARFLRFFGKFGGFPLSGGAISPQYRICASSGSVRTGALSPRISNRSS